MRNKPWQIIILSILILAILIGLSGCTSKVVKNLENGFDTLTHVPDHIGNIVSGLLSGLSDIGGALADQISNIVGGMTGH